MKLEYQGIKDNDEFILTDLNCHSSLELLSKKGLYKIIWNTTATTQVYLDYYKIELKKNEMLFCTPLNVLSLLGSDHDLKTFIFNKEFFCIQTHDDQVSCNGLLFYGSSHPQIIQLNEKEISHFQLIYEQLKEDFTIKDHLQGEMLRSILKRLLIMSTRMVKADLHDSDIPNAQIDIVRQFNLLVEKHFREYHQVKDYANLLFKSPKTLANLFLKYNDKTPLTMINERILLEAKRLLLYSDKSSNEIGLELGYKDAGHFSKFFKKHEGVTPIVFRKSRLEKENSIA